MNRFLKSVDPVLWPAAAACGLLLSRLKSERRGGRTLILRPGGMGDLIMAQLASEMLGIPPDSIEWAIERRSEAWAGFARLRYRCYDHAAISTAFAWRARYARVVNTEQRFGLSQAFALACRAPGGRLWCFASNRAARLATDRVDYDWRDEHELDAFLRLFSAAFERPLSPRSPISRRLPATGVPVVGLAGLEAPSRSLSLDRYEPLVRPWLGSEAGLICAAPRDRAFASQLAARFGARLRVFEGTFPEMCDLIGRSSRLFSMDGGMVHIASYFGVPVTAVFTSGRERKWSPLSKGSFLIRRGDLTCQPCTRFGQTPPCPHQYACKELVYPDHHQPLS